MPYLGMTISKTRLDEREYIPPSKQSFQCVIFLGTSHKRCFLFIVFLIGFFVYLTFLTGCAEKSVIASWNANNIEKKTSIIKSENWSTLFGHTLENGIDYSSFLYQMIWSKGFEFDWILFYRKKREKKKMIYFCICNYSLLIF